jgi:dihydroxyacetone kinase-like protein
MMSEAQQIAGQAVSAAVLRACAALDVNYEYLLGLDQAMGDGDLGITLQKIATKDREFARNNPVDDIGKFLAALGMETNKAAPSTMGTLIATALMRAGKEAKGLAELTPEGMVKMLAAADDGIQERGKAKLGDKTVVDALHPAREAFANAIAAGDSIQAAGQKMLAAAESGRDSVTPLQSRIGRASWVGERTIGLVDPGCAALVVLLKAIIGSD